jgi:hypothetical protein
MTQGLTNRVKAIKNNPGTGEFVDISEINAAFDKFDNHFIPAAKIWSSVDQSIPNNVNTQFTYNTTIFDSYAARSEGAMADLANDWIIIRKAGPYYVHASNLWVAGTAAGILRVNLAINGTVSNSVFDGPQAAAKSQDIFGEYIFAVGDKITCSGQQSQGSARLNTNNTYQNIFTLAAIWAGTIVEV